MRKLVQLLFITLVFACNNDDEDVPNMCVDETLVNFETPCPFVIDPVCGCDGNTYNNSCEAFNYYGIIAYADGSCD